MRKSFKNKICFLFIAVLINGFVFSQDIINYEQDKQQNVLISASFVNGNVFPTNLFVKGDNLQNSPIKHYRSLSFKALWQNPGYADWQKVYKGPYYGFGLSMGDFGNPSEIGYPVSLYGVLGIPIVRQKKLELFTEIQFGIANNWRYYNPITNPKNFAVGGAFTLHLDLGLKMFYSVSPKFDLGFGMSFIHFSNGGLKRPNHGLNIYSPLAELRYRFAPRPDYKNIQKPTKMEKSRDILFMRVGSVHQLAEFEPDSNYFAIFGYSIIVFDQISNAVRLGVGRDMNYWWGMTANTDGTMGARSIENLSVGYIFQPEMIIGKLTLVGGIGIYAKHLLYGDFKQTYQRLGVRFDIYKTFSLGVNVRAINFSQAEFMEFNLGYKLQWFR